MIKYKYCPHCSTILDISQEYPKCLSCQTVFYQNSKPTAAILLVKGKKVLLAKRGIEPYKGCYDIIGGFLLSGEHPIDGVCRETLEETGLKVKPTKILGMYMDKYGKNGDDTLNIVFIGKIISGKLLAQDDVSELEWVDIKNINKIKDGFKNTLLALKDLKKLYS